MSESPKRSRRIANRRPITWPSAQQNKKPRRSGAKPSGKTPSVIARGSSDPAEGKSAIRQSSTLSHYQSRKSAWWTKNRQDERRNWTMDSIDTLLFLHKTIGRMCEIAANQNLPSGPRAVILRIATEIMEEAKGLQATVGSLAVLRRVASDRY
jgi:hypothetical protein